MKLIDDKGREAIIKDCQSVQNRLLFGDDITLIYHLSGTVNKTDIKNLRYFFQNGTPTSLIPLNHTFTPITGAVVSLHEKYTGLDYKVKTVFKQI